MSSPAVHYFTLCAMAVLALVSIGISVELLIPRSGAGIIAIVALLVITAGIVLYRFAKRVKR